MIPEFTIDKATLRMTACMLNRRPLAEILRTAEEILGNPIFLSDTSSRILQYSNIDTFRRITNDDVILDVLEHGFVTAEYFEKYNYVALFDLISRTPTAFLRDAVKSEQRRILCRIMVNGSWFGWLAAYPLNMPFVPEDLQFINMLAQVVSLEIERNKIGFAMSYRENLLMELLSDIITDSETFRTHAAGFGWNPGHDFFVMAIQSRSNSHPIALAAVKNHLALIYPRFKSLLIDNTLILLLETEDFEAVRGTLDPFIYRTGLRAGCSCHFTEIINFRKYYQQAVSVLQMGIRYYPDHTICFFEDLLPESAVLRLDENTNIHDFCLSGVRELKRIDQEFNTPYIETLRALLYYRNMNQTAHFLNIHRNTLNYRLQKIREILPLELNEGRDIYAVYLSLLVLDLFPDK